MNIAFLEEKKSIVLRDIENEFFFFFWKKQTHTHERGKLILTQKAYHKFYSKVMVTF